MPSHEQAALPQRHILCMKWGTKYGPEYVNRLYAMVRRHLSGDFNFVCLTDDPKGIRSEVQCFPIPPLDLELAPGQVDRAWKKLTTFEENLYGLRGRALFIDLDVVIVGSLDEFFEYPGEFLIIHDYARPWRRRRITGNSSVYRFEIGAHQDVLDNLVTNHRQIFARYRNSQTYVSDHIGDITWWPDAWCVSFKKHCMPGGPFGLFNWFMTPRRPDGARIVVFHGDPKPEYAISGHWPGRWSKHVRPTPWVAEHWG